MSDDTVSVGFVPNRTDVVIVLRVGAGTAWLNAAEALGVARTLELAASNFPIKDKPKIPAQDGFISGMGADIPIAKASEKPFQTDYARGYEKGKRDGETTRFYQPIEKTQSPIDEQLKKMQSSGDALGIVGGMIRGSE